jgi:hypothetical protein
MTGKAGTQQFWREFDATHKTLSALWKVESGEYKTGN